MTQSQYASPLQWPVHFAQSGFNGAFEVELSGRSLRLVKPQKRWSRILRTCVSMRVHGPSLRLPDFGTFRSQRRETQVSEASLSLIVPNNADHDGNVARDAETDSRAGSAPRSAEAVSAPTVAHRDRSGEVHDRKRGAWASAHGMEGGGGDGGRCWTGWMDSEPQNIFPMAGRHRGRVIGLVSPLATRNRRIVSEGQGTQARKGFHRWPPARATAWRPRRRG